jgi:hypothetical protein
MGHFDWLIIKNILTQTPPPQKETTSFYKILHICIQSYKCNCLTFTQHKIFLHNFTLTFSVNKFHYDTYTSKT